MHYMSYHAVTRSLVHHLRGVLTPPFAEDALAWTVFLHEVPSVVAQAMAVVRRNDIDALIEHFVQTKAYWSAARL